MPWPGEPIGKSVMPNSAAFADSASICRFEISSVTGPGRRRDVVVHGRDREVGAANRATVQTQSVERLRAGDLVHQVEIHVEEVRLAVGAMDDVAFPDLLGERLR